MPPSPTRHVSSSGRRRASAGVAAVLAAALAGTGCSSAGDSAAPAKGPVRGIAEITGFATTPPEPKDFVRQTRTPNADFMPVGVTPPARALKPKTPEELKAMEADLENTLTRLDAASGRKRSNANFRSAAAPGDKPKAVPRGSDRFLIKPADTPAPAPRAKPKPAQGDQTKS